MANVSLKIYNSQDQPQNVKFGKSTKHKRFLQASLNLKCFEKVLLCHHQTIALCESWKISQKVCNFEKIFSMDVDAKGTKF